jgi:6-pyruvoyltetrahydropterin/6-carboxytetrahydropterin synthase
MAKVVYLTRRERFNAAHKLYNEQWSEAKNLEVFGKCANPNWHGHNYDLYVTVKGELNPETGYCMDLRFLSDLVERKVTSKTDHRNLNLDVDFMRGKMASTENLAIAIWEELELEIAQQGCLLHCIRLEETENNFVEYYGAT